MNLPRPLQPREHGLLEEHEISTLWHSLTEKQQSWLQEYLSNGLNATQAVRDSAYKSTDPASCRSIGWENRNHPKIKPLIEHACRHAMTENEVLRRVSDIARATWEDFLSFENGRVKIDLEKARQRGKLHLVKEIRQDTRQVGEHEEEVYIKKIKLKDDQKAHDQLLRAHGTYEADEEGGAKVENLTIQQWNTQINQHLQGETDETPWPAVPDPEE